jgi:hypothetical protein
MPSARCIACALRGMRNKAPAMAKASARDPGAGGEKIGRREKYDRHFRAKSAPGCEGAVGIDLRLWRLRVGLLAQRFGVTNGFETPRGATLPGSSWNQW